MIIRAHNFLPVRPWVDGPEAYTAPSEVAPKAPIADAEHSGDSGIVVVGPDGSGKSVAAAEPERHLEAPPSQVGGP